MTLVSAQRAMSLNLALATPTYAGKPRPLVSTMRNRALSAAANGITPTQNNVRMSTSLEPPAAADTIPTTNGPDAATTRPML